MAFGTDRRRLGVDNLRVVEASCAAGRLRGNRVPFRDQESVSGDGRDLAHRIDHGGRGLSAAAKEVGDRHRISVQELPQDNGRLRVFPSWLPRRLSQQRNDINILYD